MQEKAHPFTDRLVAVPRMVQVTLVAVLMAAWCAKPDSR
jgi:hypothetical protein